MMRRKFIFLFLIGLLAADASQLLCIQQSHDKDVDAVKYPEFAKFVKKYRCSQEIEQLVKDNEQHQKYIQNSVREYTSIPFYNKGQRIDRIINAERMKKVIESNKLDRIAIPDKCLCQMYKNEWNVIVKKITPDTDPLHISLLEAEQLTKLIEATMYGDIHDWNVWRDDQQKIVIIDTENRSYLEDRFKPYLYLFSFVCSHSQSKEVVDWLRSYIEMLQESHQSKLGILKKLLFDKGVICLPDNNQYDDPDIDLEEVRQEFAQLQNENRKQYNE